ncbi:hypothetical protein KEM54_003068 [Ascosphaera aggregata]|nr:hypothetical protein KEM54_003068 [Ascosphaera aggregata]
MLGAAADSTGFMMTTRLGSVRFQLTRCTTSLRLFCSFSSGTGRHGYSSLIHPFKCHDDTALDANGRLSLAQTVNAQVGAVRTAHSRVERTELPRDGTAALEAAADAVRDSTIHIEMIPPVTSLVQSQLVLQALQRFGEVATFLNSKYNATNIRSKKTRNAGHSAIVVFESPQAAAAAKAASPLTVPVKRQRQQQRQSSSICTSDVIKVTIEESTHLHDQTIRHNPFYGFFPIHTDSIEVQDLIRTNSTYHSAPTPAFADCFTARKRAVPTRIKEAIAKYNARNGAISLMELWERGKEEGGEVIEDELNAQHKNSGAH